MSGAVNEPAEKLVRAIAADAQAIIEEGAPPSDLIMVFLTVADVIARRHGQHAYLLEAFEAVQRQGAVLDAEEAAAKGRVS